MKSLMLFVSFAMLFSSCAPRPTYVIGGVAQKIEETRVVFVNLDPEFEYLVYVPKTKIFGAGYWVYVPSQKHSAMSADALRGILDGTSLQGAPLAQSHTSSVDCPVGIISFSYLVFRQGRLLSNGVSSFTLFIVPAPSDRARVVNLSGRKL